MTRNSPIHNILAKIFIICMCALTAGCSPSLPQITSSTGSNGANSTTSGAPTSACASNSTAAICALGQGIQNGTMFVEPDAGYKPIVDAIKSAQKSIQLEIYLLTQRSVIYALEDAANRGVSVQVMLEPHPYGGGSPTATLDKLSAAGVQAKTTNPSFALTHAKFMIIDHSIVFISSANFTASALGGSSYTTNREYIVEENNAAEAQELETIFTADWNRTTPALTDPNLLVSPINSFTDTIKLINSAKKSIIMEEEEMNNTDVMNALIAAEKRGVKVQIVTPVLSSSSDAQEEQQESAAGIQVVQLNDKSGALYIHAKMIVVDGTLGYVGSVNVSTASFNNNREVGVLISSSSMLQQLETAFAADVQG